MRKSQKHVICASWSLSTFGHINTLLAAGRLDWIPNYVVMRFIPRGRSRYRYRLTAEQYVDVLGSRQ